MGDVSTITQSSDSLPVASGIYNSRGSVGLCQSVAPTLVPTPCDQSTAPAVLILMDPIYVYAPSTGENEAQNLRDVLDGETCAIISNLGTFIAGSLADSLLDSSTNEPATDAFVVPELDSDWYGALAGDDVTALEAFTARGGNLGGGRKLQHGGGHALP